MKVFIGMETSGVLRRAFSAAGHQVISCDLLPAQDAPTIGIHIIGDVFETLDKLKAAGWWPDLAVFHPDCTYLTSSAEWAYKDPDFVRYPGVGYHQRLKPGTLFGAARRKAREEAVQLVKRIWSLPIRRKAVENPIGHLSRHRRPTQVVQPYQFGHDASKATCLWLDNLPPIEPTSYCRPRMFCPACEGVSDYDAAYGHGCPHCGAEAGLLRPRWANQTNGGQNRLPPSDDRWKTRADTFPGIGAAMVAKWAT